MDISCEFRMGQYRGDDHQDDALHFIKDFKKTGEPLSLIFVQAGEKSFPHFEHSAC